MCIAILNQKGFIKDKYIKNSWENNNQGAGLLYTQAGVLKTFKTYEYSSFLSEYKRVRACKDVGKIVLHFRIATSGHIKYVNLHPFLVNDQLGFVHNGIISGLGDKDYSDTYYFNTILQRINGDFLNDEGVKLLIEGYIGSSKLVFLDSANNHTIINEDWGMWEGDNWYSNDSYKQSWDYVYYGNVKKKKTKGTCTIDDDGWGDWYSKYDTKEYKPKPWTDTSLLKDDYIDDYEVDVYDHLSFFDNVTHENVSFLSEFLYIPATSSEFIREVNNMSYELDTYDMNEMIKKITEMYQIEL